MTFQLSIMASKVTADQPKKLRQLVKYGFYSSLITLVGTFSQSETISCVYLKCRKVLKLWCVIVVSGFHDLTEIYFLPAPLWSNCK